MAVMSASEVSRNFSDIVDRAMKGERIEIIRHGKIVAELGPSAGRPNGAAIIAAMSKIPPAEADDDWYAEIEATRTLLTEDRDPWAE